jgi:hypothetical protein
MFFSSELEQSRFLPFFARTCKYRLFSCHEGYVKAIDPWMQHSIEQGNTDQELMLDSGAFTAWTKGKEVRLSTLISTYRKFMRKYEQQTKTIWLLNLDRIPGRKGETPTARQVADALAESDKNFGALHREFGDRVLPVYHQGEPASRLDEVCAMSTYIGVSPRQGLGERNRLNWVRELHGTLDRTRIRTHGLATTGTVMSTTVDWHSIDSAAWRIRAWLGMTYFNFGDKIRSINVSAQSPAQYDKGRHYRSMSKAQQEFLSARAAANGVSMEELENDTLARAYNAYVEIASFFASKQLKTVQMPSLIGDFEQ